MDKSTFKDIITRLQKSEDRGREAYKLGVDTSNFTEDYEVVIDKLLSELFNSEQLSWINWYLWERESLTKPGKFHKAYKKENGKRVEICHNIDSLFEVVHEAGHPQKIDPNRV
jgi:NAD-dependent SIR2 family protein deacetylase